MFVAFQLKNYASRIDTQYQLFIIIIVICIETVSCGDEQKKSLMRTNKVYGLRRRCWCMYYLRYMYEYVNAQFPLIDARSFLDNNNNNVIHSTQLIQYRVYVLTNNEYYTFNLYRSQKQLRRPQKKCTYIQHTILYRIGLLSIRSYTFNYIQLDDAAWKK